MANSSLASLPIGFRDRGEWRMPDVFAGLALWAVMVPEGMAYAGIVGVHRSWAFTPSSRR